MRGHRARADISGRRLQLQDCIRHQALTFHLSISDLDRLGTRYPTISVQHQGSCTTEMAACAVPLTFDAPTATGSAPITTADDVRAANLASAVGVNFGVAGANITDGGGAAAI